MLITHNLGIKIDGTDLFKNINISLDSSSKKKVALVGRNGCGKSTLLKILNQEIKPTSGNIRTSNEILGYLEQEVDLKTFELVGEFLESKIQETWEEYKIETALRDVGLDLDYLYKPIKHLSGGEKIKIALAGLLINEPTILLFDEPTNNLDTNGIEWLIEFIKKFRGSAIIVSHDRHLINTVVNELWEIDPDTLSIKVYGGNYNSFLEEKERNFRNMLNNYNLIDREIKDIEMWLRENEFHPKYRFSGLVMSQKKKLEKLKENRIEKPSATPQIDINDLREKKHGLIVKVDINKKAFGESTVIKELHIKIHADERVLISGENGSGKSTLLKMITGIDNDYEGTIEFGTNVKIGYLQQFSILDKSKSILHEFEKHTMIDSPRSRSILDRYGFDVEMIDNKILTLSYGQLKRLDLAIILAKEPNLLILDEPTNHLDIYTKEDLEEFIVKQNIPMIIVSHDKYFIEKVKITKEIKIG